MPKPLPEYDRLCANEVHLWMTFFDDPALADVMAACQRLLSVDERAQAQRFHAEAAGRRHVVTRALLRCTLSRYADVAPEDWRFDVNDHGRPRIAASHGLTAPLDFNLSHSKGLVVLGLSVHQGLGVDTEHLARRANIAQLAAHSFATSEQASLAVLSPADQRERFFAYWTLKEAYIKARGMGLAIALDQFAFDLSRPGQIGFHADPSLNDDAAQWAFQQWLLPPDHLLALCLRRQGDGPLPQVRLWRTVPLGASQYLPLASTRQSRSRA